jgi:glycosyltransferase involved in cell wall biosynthesis
MSKIPTHPPLSIGLPIYNGENYMRLSIDSILSQTFEDFELIISDNGSTDSTQRICEEYASQDTRIRYYRNEKNMGMTWNFNHVFELARGKYFKWISHDDIHKPTLLEKCYFGLKERESDGYVCCWPNTIIIDENGDELYEIKEPPMRLESDSVHERFKDGTYARHSSFQFHGVMLAETLRETCLLGPWLSSDYTMIGQVALRGKIYQIPDYLYVRRYHKSNSYRTCQEDYYTYATYWVEPEKKNDILMPYWRMAFEATRGVFKVPMSIKDRVMCLFHVISNRNQHRGFSQYLRDPVHAIKLLLQRAYKK